MPQLTLTADKLESVPEPVRQYYKQADEDDAAKGFILDIDSVENHPEVTGLRNTVKALKPKGKLVDKIKGLFPDVDDDALDTAIKTAVDAAKKTAGKGGKVDEDDIAKRVEKELGEKMAEITPELEAGKVAQKELRSERIENQARRALAKAGVMGEREETAVKLIVESLNLDEKDIKKVVVLDKDGDPRSISLEDYTVKEFKKAHPYLFTGTGSSGSGSEGSRRTSGTQDMSKMSAAEKIKAGLDQRNHL